MGSEGNSYMRVFINIKMNMRCCLCKPVSQSQLSNELYRQFVKNCSFLTLTIASAFYKYLIKIDSGELTNTREYMLRRRTMYVTPRYVGLVEKRYGASLLKIY